MCEALGDKNVKTGVGIQCKNFYKGMCMACLPTACHSLFKALRIRMTDDAKVRKAKVTDTL